MEGKKKGCSGEDKTSFNKFLVEASPVGRLKKRHKKNGGTKLGIYVEKTARENGNTGLA